MYPLESILYILRSELSEASGVLFWSAILMAVPAALTTLFAAGKLNVAEWSKAFRVMACVWPIGSIVFAVSYLAIIGAAGLAFSGLGIRLLTDSVSLAFSLIGMALTISCWWMYRWCYHWLSPHAEFGYGVSEAPDDTSPRYTFSLRSLFLYQSLLVVLLAIWIGNRREYYAKEYHWRIEQLEFANWKQSVETRFRKNGITPMCDQRPRRLFLQVNSMNVGFREQALDLVVPADNLVGVYISDHALTDAGVATLSKIDSIEQLHLQSKQVTDAGIASLTEMPKLRKLYIICPQLTDKCLDHLAAFPALDKLSIIEPAFSKAAKERFRPKRDVNHVQICTKPTSARSDSAGSDSNQCNAEN